MARPGGKAPTPPEVLFLGNLGGTRRQPPTWLRTTCATNSGFPCSRRQIRRLDLHTVRHTFASRLIVNGENLKYIAEQLGHASIKITVDIYGHLIPGGNRQAVDRLDTPVLVGQPDTEPDSGRGDEVSSL